MGLVVGVTMVIWDKQDLYTAKNILCEETGSRGSTKHWATDKGKTLYTLSGKNISSL